MLSTRKQKAKENRTRHCDVMSDIEKLDVMLGSYQRENSESQNENDENTLDQRSDRREGLNQNENDYRSSLNNNPSENSCLTVETSRAISSEIIRPRKFEEMQTNLNSQIIDVINAAIENKVHPSNKNAVKSQSSAKKTILDLRSDGPIRGI